jgi:hypothetical protein
MSLLSHLLRPLPVFFIGLAAMASAEEPAPSPPARPPAPAGWQYTKEQLATKPVNLMLLHCSLLMQYNGDDLRLREQKTPPTAAELAEHRKASAAKRADSWKEINAVKESVTAVALDPETRFLGTSAVEIYEATRQIDSQMQQIFAKVDSGTPMDSPEERAMFVKMNPLLGPQEKRLRQTMDEVKRILHALADAKAAAKASPEPAPTPAPAKPGTITPAKKSSKDDLPPGMTRK